MFTGPGLFKKKDFTVVRFFIHNMYVVQWDDHETISEVVTRLDFILSNIKKKCSKCESDTKLWPSIAQK